VVNRAEGVRDAVLAAVADQRDADVPESVAAVRAALEPVRHVRRLLRRSGIPVRALNRPRDEVFEATEDGAALARLLHESKAVVALDTRTAPGAALCLR
jgi:hypothetical protein